MNISAIKKWPKVGETWMTSFGTVEIMCVGSNENHPSFCGKASNGNLCIFDLDELKPISPAVMFTKAVINAYSHEIDDTARLQDLLIVTAQLIESGQLEAELSALGYTKTQQ